MIRLAGGILLLSLLFSLVACDQSEEERQAIVDRGVEIRIAEFIEKRNQKCREKAVEKAIAISDSLLREEGLTTRIETVEKPPAASKPSMPAMKSLPDSVDHKMLRERDKG